MAIPTSGGGGGVDAGFIPLIDFLQDKLGGYFFQREGMGTEDIAYLNLIRLRALFENTGEKSTLLQKVDTTQPDNLLTVHDAAFGTNSDRISAAVNALFGQPGRINVNLGGNDLPDGTEASVSVRNQWTDMQRQGDPDEVVNQEPVGVLAPDDGTGDGVSDVTPPRPVLGRGADPDSSADAPSGDQQAATDNAPRPADGGGLGSAPLDPTLPEEGAPRQIPGGAELWRVGGRDVYLAYEIPGTDVPLVWKVENPDRLKAIYGDDVPDYDRELTKAQFNRQSPWYAGLSAEIQNTDEHPWQQFMSDFNQAAELRPWLRDPTVQAVMATAYLEEREPTSDELSRTDWWQGHTADERAWMEESATMGRKEVRRRKDTAARTVAEMLREEGMSNAPQSVVDYIATQRLTGKWSEQYTNEQIRKLADPWAPGKLDKGILAAIRDPEMGETADARAISEGRDAVRERLRAIFENRRVPIATSDETEQQRLNRITRQIMQGERTFSDVRNSVDWIAARTDGGRVGGLDVADEGRDRVRQLARQWLGPVAGNLEGGSLDEWAGAIRNDPDGEELFIEYLRGERQAMFKAYDPSLTYEQIVGPVRNMATDIWGQSVHDEMFLVDLANMESYTDMQQRLRQEGLSRNVEKVTFDALSGLQATDLGGQVVRSQV